MPVQKIDLGKIIQELKEEVLSIENSDASTNDKTRAFKAAGRRFRMRVYGDKRRYSGKNKERRITLNTYNSYLTRVRKVFEEAGLRHHLLDRDVERLQKRYPGHSEDIGALSGMPPKETRLAKKALEKQLHQAIDLQRYLGKLDFSLPSAKRAVDRLRKEHPAYKEQLAALLGDDALASLQVLNDTLDEAEPLLEDLAALKINHEVMYALQMEKSLRAAHTEKKEERLGVKKRTTVAIHYPHYIQAVTNLLLNPTQSGSSGAMYAMAPLAFALCAATGRRPIEVLVQGEFAPVLLDNDEVDPHRLEFTGQAKKRSGDPDKWFTIYTLAPAAAVLQAIKHLRALPQVADLPATKGVDNDTRSLNAKIASRVGAPLNTYAKEFFSDHHRTVKDTRAIYARIAYELWFKRDPRWKSSDEDVFFAELLGHDDETTQMHYKQFKVHECDPGFTPETEQRSGRLDRLEELDEQMPDLARGSAAVDLHEAVKAQLEKEPATKFTQQLIYDISGAYRPLIQRYMGLCAGALGIERQENGRWKQLDELKPPVMVEIDAEPETEESTKAKTPAQPKKATKPRVTWEKVDGLWRAAVLIDGEEVAHSLNADRTTAAQEAWSEYQALEAEI